MRSTHCFSLSGKIRIRHKTSKKAPMSLRIPWKFSKRKTTSWPCSTRWALKRWILRRSCLPRQFLNKLFILTLPKCSLHLTAGARLKHYSDKVISKISISLPDKARLNRILRTSKTYLPQNPSIETRPPKSLRSRLFCTSLLWRSAREMSRYKKKRLVQSKVLGLLAVKLSYPQWVTTRTQICKSHLGLKQWLISPSSKLLTPMT